MGSYPANDYFKINGTSFSDRFIEYDDCETSTFSQYSHNGSPLTVWVPNDSWNISTTISQYKVNGTSIASLERGSRPTCVNKGNALFKGGTANDNDLYIICNSSGIRIRSKSGDVDTLYVPSYFPDGVLPQRLWAIVQSAGGGATFNSNAGGGGAVWSGMIKIVNNRTVYIRGGKGGSAGNNGANTTIGQYVQDTGIISTWLTVPAGKSNGDGGRWILPLPSSDGNLWTIDTIHGADADSSFGERTFYLTENETNKQASYMQYRTIGHTSGPGCGGASAFSSGIKGNGSDGAGGGFVAGEYGTAFSGGDNWVEIYY